MDGAIDLNVLEDARTRPLDSIAVSPPHLSHNATSGPSFTR